MAEARFMDEVDLERIDLISYTGYRTDIRTVFEQLDIFEDVFSNTMTGQIAISDAAGLIDTLPIVGQEQLDLVFRTPDEQTISKIFYIYKMTERTFGKKVTGYILNFISKEAIQSINFKFSRSYEGNIGASVQKIFRQVMESDSKLEIETPINDYKFITPYWSPFEAINWLARRSISSNGAASYVMYENNQTYRFCSLATLMTAPVKFSYVHSDVNAESLGYNIKEGKSVIRKIYQDTSFDQIRATTSGMYAGTLGTYDMTSKSIKFTSFDYLGSFDSTPHLDDFPLTTKSVPYGNLATLNFIEKYGYRYGDKLESQQYENWYMQNNSLLEQAATYKLTIEVSGKTDIKAGDTVELTIGQFNTFGTDEANDMEDRTYSGKYLVTAIRHSIAANKHMMYLEVIKDSFATELKTKKR